MTADVAHATAVRAAADRVERELGPVDLLGPFHCARAFVPAMVARAAGRVVDLSSGAGLFRVSGNLHAAGYAAGLRAFEISPGVVRSDMTEAMASHAVPPRARRLGVLPWGPDDPLA